MIKTDFGMIETDFGMIETDKETVKETEILALDAYFLELDAHKKKEILVKMRIEAMRKSFSSEYLLLCLIEFSQDNREKSEFNEVLTGFNDEVGMLFQFPSTSSLIEMVLKKKATENLTMREILN